jgi:hypothetical protein
MKTEKEIKEEIEKLLIGDNKESEILIHSAKNWNFYTITIILNDKVVCSIQLNILKAIRNLDLNSISYHNRKIQLLYMYHFEEN